MKLRLNNFINQIGIIMDITEEDDVVVVTTTEEEVEEGPTLTLICRKLSVTDVISLGTLHPPAPTGYLNCKKHQRPKMMIPAKLKN